MRHLRWGSALMPFNRFLPPEYGDGIDTVRVSVDGSTLSSARFVSLLVHGSQESEAPVTLMIAQWGQLIDHDLTSTAQPRSVNGSVPRCCGTDDFHPSCLPIKVPLDDPWLAPLKVRCLEFLRSAPAQRRDCVLSWREQTNQATSYLDASPVYSSNARNSDNARVFRNGLLQFGRGNPEQDMCLRGTMSSSCIRPGDGRSGEQPGLMAMHHVWVGEHNRIALELSDLNPHWSDEKVYQETRRIVGALFQHITYREFLPLVVGREVCRLFELDLLNSGYFEDYDPEINPTVANSFGAAAFRFGHSLIQNTYMRCDKNHNFLDNNVPLHNENVNGDIGNPGSLHRLLRGLAAQKAQMRDEFITAELTNHLFQSGSFPFGLDLAAINIQRGRDHGIPPYTSWREPCGLTPIQNWHDFEKVVGIASAKRISHAYRSVHDIDLFVGGIAERPVIGGLVGPTFACIIAQQFSNLRKGDRFWYENPRFENSFTPAQLHSIRRVSLAQIICRTLGGGTLQPHIFIPHDIPGNERLPCGVGLLAPIDLLPWLEEDPFQQHRAPPSAPIQPSFQDHLPPQSSPAAPLFDTIDFIPNGSTGLQKQPVSDVHSNTSTTVSDKLDLKFPPRFTSTQPPKRNTANKPTTKKRKTSITKTRPTSSPNKKIQDFTTRRTVIINNIPVILRRSADPFSTEILDAETRSQDLDLLGANSTDRKKGHDTIHVHINRINRTSTFTTKNDTFKDRPEERHYANQETIYGTNTGQKVRVPRPSSEEYEIEINIRQTNNRRPGSSYYYGDFNSKYDNYDTVSTPFSYRPSTFRPTHEQFSDYRPYTKPPKIIYLDNQDDYTTTTTPAPNLLQTFLMAGQNAITDHFQKPGSIFHSNIFGGGGNSGTSSALSSSSSAANSLPISSAGFGNGPGGSTSHSNTNTHNIFNINIRPAGQNIDLSDSPISLPASSASYGLHSTSKLPPPLNYNQAKPNNPFSTNYPPYQSSPSYDAFPYRDYDRNRLTTSTPRRPYYRPTNSYYPRTKDASLLATPNKNLSSAVPSKDASDFSDYDLLSFSSKISDNASKSDDYYDDSETDLAAKFDKDGYLRPEHMILEILNHTDIDYNATLTKDTNKNDTNATSKDDFVLPALMETEAVTKQTKQNKTSYYDAIPRRPATEILAEDYDEIPLPKPRHKVQKNPPNLVPFAPLNVLTKPERPDNWVIFDEPKEQDLLPEIPVLNTGNPSFMELPKPITVRVRNGYSRKAG
ncbi:uncharacterized protein LOC119651583 isoform X2 [Hermetia illucens]|nr:uncharacterized protein LOC119651583 isoform X2 [Hermetia illucens]